MIAIIDYTYTKGDPRYPVLPKVPSALIDPLVTGLEMVAKTPGLTKSQTDRLDDARVILELMRGAA